MSEISDRVVIVGASAAGIATAEALRSNGFDGEIILIGEEPYLPYDRPPLSKQLLAGDQDFDFVRLASDEQCRDARLELMLGRRVARVEPSRKTVVLDNDQAVAYDTLIIASGVRPRTLPATADLDYVVTLRGYDDAVRLRDRLETGARVLIVGAGFIGLEVAATAIKKGCDVHVVEPAPAALSGRFPAELVELIEDKHRDHGVKFHFGNVVETWHRADDGEVSSVTLRDRTELDVDVALVGIGTVPAVDWLEGSGLTLENGVVCDERGLAGESIYAVGDVANWYHPRIQRQLRVEHRLSAGEQAQVVAADVTGAELPELDLPFFWTDQYDDKWQMYGYTHPDAQLEIVLEEPQSNRLVAVLKRDGRIESVIGKNAARQLIPYRRDLKTANTLAPQS
ncbi:FAD-dependent oxidoreductase [Arthrobacter sp. NPDC089319]|uniref:NAD(P)/FAD-dependent oxidoreductase n=1 Tax=Arthrobacter sp. NPDC089319 TaxID=3155915 RepID=UPI00343EA38A